MSSIDHPLPGMRGVLRMTLLVGLVLSLPGCLIVAAYGPESTEIVRPVVTEPRLLPPRSGGEIAAPAEHLLQCWGDPDRVKTLSNGAEIWEYQGDLQWHGVLIHVIVVPVPLFLPVGRDVASFRVREGRVVSVETQGEKLRLLAVAGLVVSPCGSPFELALRFETEDGAPDAWVDLRR